MARLAHLEGMVATFLQNRTEPTIPLLHVSELDQPMYVVFGGRVRDPGTTDFVDLRAIDVRGFFLTYEAAFDAWRAASQSHVDEAFTKYVISRLR